MENTNKLQIIYGDVTLGVHGDGFHYIFSYQTGGLESLTVNGHEWMYRTPRPTFWRATTDNDRGNGFPLRSGMWLSADMFLSCSSIQLQVDNTELPLPIAPFNNRFSSEEYAKVVRVTFSYETITTPKTLVDVCYQIVPDGTITVQVHYHGAEGLPELPVFGMRFILPTCASGFRYDGLSGETYPDRMDGGIPGTYCVNGLPVTPYLVPQDCGVHMGTHWLEVCRDTFLDNTCQRPTPASLKFSMEDKPFAFSCLPYTAEELENATHQEELPPPRRTVVSILGAVRGVGGINSWEAEVEPPYHIDATKDICYSFRICPGY